MRRAREEQSSSGAVPPCQPALLRSALLNPNFCPRLLKPHPSLRVCALTYRLWPSLPPAVALDAYTKVARFPEAMRVALMLGTKEAVESTFLAAPDAVTRRQLAYVLGRAGWPLDLDGGAVADAVGAEAESLKELLSNVKLSELYLALARDLDVMAPKVPEDIYKTHLVEGRAATDTAVDSARSNLAVRFHFPEELLCSATRRDAKLAAGSSLSRA